MTVTPRRINRSETLRALFLIGVVGLGVQLLTPRPCAAQAGPPYQTDDPDPVPLHHFEAYVFETSDRTSDGTALSGPSFEMNWGAAPNLQLHVVLPFASNFAPDAPGQHGIGDIELGAKYRFVKEADHRPEVGVFPFVELPAGDAARGLGVGATWYRVPVWIKKSAGDWNVFGGGGEVIVHADGYKDYPFASGLVQRKLSEQLTLGVEVVGHGAESPDPSGIGRSVLADVGGFYSFTKGFQLLFAAGHSIAWQPETYTYAALYWTWGP